MRRWLAIIAFALFAPGFVAWFWAPHSVRSSDTETIYVRNLSPRYISDAEIKNDLPAWEAAANEDFAPLWHTTRVDLVFIGKRPAPKGSLSAVFVDKGDVQGALAYHTVTDGVPQIVVYAGTADYYGYSNSVSFTHELEEMLADPTICATNQGYPYPYVTVTDVGQYPQLPGTVWAQEVSDPVEAYSYNRKGADGRPVKISDFITPDWFNDEVDGPYDFMHLVQAPFTVLRGGYAQWWDGTTWSVVENFKHAGRDAAGFLKGDGSVRAAPSDSPSTVVRSHSTHSRDSQDYAESSRTNYNELLLTTQG